MSEIVISKKINLTEVDYDIYSPTKSKNLFKEV